MIRAWLGIDNDPFSLENIDLLSQQQGWKNPPHRYR